MDKNSKIYIAGHTGMVGSAIKRYFDASGYKNIITRTSSELDLRNVSDVDLFFEKVKPDYVFLAAAIVGGIQANIDQPVKFLMDNTKIQMNVIECSYKYKVKRLVFLGSSCVYPKLSPQPMKEDYLLSGKLEETNEAYAIAKIHGLKIIEYYNKQYNAKYISVMPPNMYGYNDNFDLSSSHVLAATIRKVHEAKVNKSDIVIWNDGSARREFLNVDDLPSALELLVDNYYENTHVNVGSGYDISILELTRKVMKIIGYDGRIIFDKTKPKGMPQKLMNINQLSKMGWAPKISLDEGIEKTYQWYLENLENI